MMVERSEEALKAFHYATIKYDAGKVSDMLTAGLRDPTFFCDIIDNDGMAAGALVARTQEYVHSREIYAYDVILYISPEARSLKAVMTLLHNYIKWAKKWGARQIRLEQSTGFKMEKFGALARRVGFEQIGTKWSMENKG